MNSMAHPLVRIAARVLMAGLFLLGATGCERVYEAEISGFVKDVVSEEGINGARVRIFFNDEDTSYQETLTQSGSGGDGYFVFRRVVWSSWSPVFGDEGDLRDVRVEVVKDDYVDGRADLRVVSGAGNAVGDVMLSRTFFVSEQAEGYVRDREADRDGEHPGINGLTVELFVPDADVDTDEERRAWMRTHRPTATTTTTTSEGEPGFYSFANVKFDASDALPDPDKNPHGTPSTVMLRVRDSAHFTEDVLDAVVLSGEVASVFDDVFVDKEVFTGSIEGTVRDLTTGDGLNGAAVEVYVVDEPVDSEAALLAFIDDHEPAATVNTQTGEDERDGRYVANGIRWDIAAKPDANTAHQSAAIALVVDAGAHRERVLFDDPDTPGFAAAYHVHSNQTRDLGEVVLERTDFRARAEGFVRLLPGAVDAGENGVQLSLYYDREDPDLTALDTFDPLDVDYVDQVTTRDVVQGDETWPGYFEFNNIGWDRETGGSLANGRDRLTVIVYSSGVDFSGFAGNTDPSWQRFTIVSDDGDEETGEVEDTTTLPELQFRPTRFTGSMDGYLRQTAGDVVTGANGIEIRLFYDADDRDLSETAAFDPDDSVDWSATTTTTERVVEGVPHPGYFTFDALNWRNPAGPSVGLDKDELTFILFSESFDLSGLPGNTDRRWHRFTMTSGGVHAVPDLQYFRTEFVAAVSGYVRRAAGAPDSGANGVELKLFYDADDPMLENVAAFDPQTAAFADVTSTRDEAVGDATYAGAFTFSDVFWRNPDGPSLAGGRDQARIIVFGENADFSAMEGNTDPRWHVFNIVSGAAGNQLADIVYAPPPAPFSASMDGFVRAVAGDAGTGQNGVTLQLYYDPADPDLAGLGVFDPATAAFADQVNTANVAVGSAVHPGGFAFENIAWERPGGASLASGKDTLKVIVYSPDVDFSALDGNTDPHWHMFTLVSGEAGNTIADVPLAP